MDRVCDVPIVCFISRGERSPKHIQDASSVVGVHTFISRAIQQRLPYYTEIASFLYESKAVFERVIAAPHSREIFDRQNACKKAPPRAVGAGRNISYNRFPINFSDFLNLKAEITSMEVLGDLIAEVPAQLPEDDSGLPAHEQSSPEHQHSTPRPTTTSDGVPRTSRQNTKAHDSHGNQEAEDYFASASNVSDFRGSLFSHDHTVTPLSYHVPNHHGSIPVRDFNQDAHTSDTDSVKHANQHQRRPTSTFGVRSQSPDLSTLTGSAISPDCSSISSVKSSLTTPSVAERFQAQNTHVDLAALQDRALENLPRRKQLSFFSPAVRGYVDTVLNLDEMQLLILQACLTGIASNQTSLASFRAQVTRVLPVLSEPDQEGAIEFLWVVCRNNL
jgi:hypothetical protein